MRERFYSRDGFNRRAYFSHGESDGKPAELIQRRDGERREREGIRGRV